MRRRRVSVGNAVLNGRPGMELGELLALAFLVLSLCAAYALSFDRFLGRWGR
ncbi:MAG: hypothetical protein IRZ16_19555 [Myxococcaceae bacterium]|nr:hypothetical protein [Myxococcaceae bacterium]